MRAKPSSSPWVSSWTKDAYEELSDFLKKAFDEISSNPGYVKAAKARSYKPERIGHQISERHYYTKMWAIETRETTADFDGDDSETEKDSEEHEVSLSVDPMSTNWLFDYGTGDEDKEGRKHLRELEMKLSTAADFESKKRARVEDGIDDETDEEEGSKGRPYARKACLGPNYLAMRYSTDINTASPKSLKPLGIKLPFQSIFEGLMRTNKIRQYSTFVPGIHSTYLYQANRGGGMFTLHKEDFNLGAANYCHAGVRVWVLVHASSAAALEAAIRKTIGRNDGSDSCAQWVKHRRLFLSINFLESNGVEFSTVMQREGELILTKGPVYHQGFSLGSSLAEAVNLAPSDWEPSDAGECEFGVCGAPKDHMTKDIFRKRKEGEAMSGVPNVMVGFYD